MAENYFEVETSNLNKTIDNLTNLLERLTTANNQMFTNVQSLDTMWEGTAKNEFIAQFSLDHTTMAELCQTVSKLIQALQSAKNQYEACESSVNETVSAIRISD